MYSVSRFIFFVFVLCVGAGLANGALIGDSEGSSADIRNLQQKSGQQISPQQTNISVEKPGAAITNQPQEITKILITEYAEYQKRPNCCDWWKDGYDKWNSGVSYFGHCAYIGNCCNSWKWVISQYLCTASPTLRVSLFIGYVVFYTMIDTQAEKHGPLDKLFWAVVTDCGIKIISELFYASCRPEIYSLPKKEFLTEVNNIVVKVNKNINRETNEVDQKITSDLWLNYIKNNLTITFWGGNWFYWGKNCCCIGCPDALRFYSKPSEQIIYNDHDEEAQNPMQPNKVELQSIQNAETNKKKYSKLNV
jgi:hypothetical protein